MCINQEVEAPVNIKIFAMSKHYEHGLKSFVYHEVLCLKTLASCVFIIYKEIILFE